MTEEEWLSGTHPIRMLDFIREMLTDRKQRLFAVACCRHIWNLLVDHRSRKAVEISERYADNAATSEELLNSTDDAIEAVMAAQPRADWAEAASFERAVSELGVEVGTSAAAHFASLAVTTIQFDEEMGLTYGLEGVNAEESVQSQYVRDIFGNPFRPVIFDPRWRTTDVLGVARAIYEDRAFERMPILADALMDAGCVDEQIIEHCRGNGPHVRGCWVVDLVLGKE